MLRGWYGIITGSKLREYVISRFHNVSSLSARSQHPFAEISPFTARQNNIDQGDVVLVKSNSGEIKIRVKVSDDIKAGVVYMPMGWENPNVNVVNSFP